MSSNKFNLIIVNPDETIYKGETDRVIAPGITQDIAILPDHTPLYAQLKKGTIRVGTGNNPKSFSIEGGIIRVKENKASIIVGFQPPQEKAKTQ